MIDYVANYYGAEKRPYICKKFVSSSGEESHTAINVGNEDEIDQISPETIYEHMDNVLRYLDEKMDSMSIVQLDELRSPEPWPIKGWSEVEWCQTEIVLWWRYVYYKDYDERFNAELQREFDEEQARQQALSDEQQARIDSGEIEDHYHDPITGEHVTVDPEATTTTEETPA
jgi:hypothetical protein